jgi:predicted SprT family Zn-dependent metalloprotease
MELEKAHFLANQLMNQHGISQKGWKFSFDNARRRFGCCSYRKKQISLSRPLTLLNSESEVRNTILHEIAHALTKGHHHDRVWKAKAKEIGCTGDRCYNSKLVKTPEPKYIASCKTCGTIHKRNRLTSGTFSCGVCSRSVFNPEFIINFELNPKY